jgi:hypothetical protein
MEAAGVDMACATPSEWGAQLERLIGAGDSELQHIGAHCRTFAGRAYSTGEFVRRFDDAFAAIGLVG